MGAVVVVVVVIFVPFQELTEVTIMMPNILEMDGKVTLNRYFAAQFSEVASANYCDAFYWATKWKEGASEN